MFNLNEIISRFKPNEAELNKTERIAQAITSLDETNGWQEYTKLVQGLIETGTPEVASFTPEQATVISGQMAYVSGLKRALRIMDQQKDILASMKKPDDN